MNRSGEGGDGEDGGAGGGFGGKVIPGLERSAIQIEGAIPSKGFAVQIQVTAGTNIVLRARWSLTAPTVG